MRKLLSISLATFCWISASSAQQFARAGDSFTSEEYPNAEYGLDDEKELEQKVAVAQLLRCVAEVELEYAACRLEVRINPWTDKTRAGCKNAYDAGAKKCVDDNPIPK